LKLDERVQGLLIEDMISTGHARALLAITDKEEQYNMAMRIFDEKISVRETEKMVQAYNNPKVLKKKENIISESDQVVFQNIEKNLKEIFGTKVSIQRKTKDKGKLEIEYYSSEELERIIELLESVRGERN
ncbi:MAG: chromosome partitioning protein ParB, partial [Clostridium sp.]|nr:chromosome partitioning protein ParB [Clostridium sp.]